MTDREDEAENADLAEVAFPVDEAAPATEGNPAAGKTAQDRIDALKSFVKSRLTCADSVDIERGAKLTFGKDCV